MIDVGTALATWIPRVQGQYLNEDWNPDNQGFGAQCWDTAANWMKTLGLPIINTGSDKGRWPGWAGNMVDAFPQTPEIVAAYELIGPDQPGRPGDIAMWGDSYWYYPKTHVAPLIRDIDEQLPCMSQNSTAAQLDNPYPQWTAGPTTIQHLPRQGLIGFIRPRTGTSIQLNAAITPTRIIDPQEEIMIVKLDAQQADDIARAAARYAVEEMNGKLLIHPLQAESIVQATTGRVLAQVKAQANGVQIERQQADDIARAAARYTEEAGK